MALRIAVPLFVLAMLTTSCVIWSGNRIFQYEEFFTYYSASDDSFTNMLAANSDGIHASPPAYFILLWIWARFFGTSELALRIPSSICLSIAFVLLFRFLSRAYSVRSAGLGLVFVFCFSSWIVYPNIEARFYGQFLLVNAIMVLSYQSRHLSYPPRSTWFVWNGIVHGLAVLTHYFGFCFSAMVLLSAMAQDFVQGRRQTRFYLSIVVSWLAFVPWIPSLLGQRQRYSTFWLPPPALTDLFEVYKAGLDKLALPLVLLLAGYFLFVRRLLRSARPGLPAYEDTSASLQRGSVLLALSFFLVPLIIWGQSRIAFPLFYGKYFMPITIGWAIVLTHIAHLLIDRPERPRSPLPAGRIWFRRWWWGRLAYIATLLVMLAFPVFGALTQPRPIMPKMHELGYTSLPVAIESPHDFFPLSHYLPDGHRYYFILDSESVQRADSPRRATAIDASMTSLKRYYPTPQIVSGEEFLANHESFLLLDRDFKWSERIMQDPDTYKLLGQFGQGNESAPIYLVQRGRSQKQ